MEELLKIIDSINKAIDELSSLNRFILEGIASAFLIPFYKTIGQNIASSKIWKVLKSYSAKAWQYFVSKSPDLVITRVGQFIFLGFVLFLLGVATIDYYNGYTDSFSIIYPYAERFTIGILFLEILLRGSRSLLYSIITWLGFAKQFGLPQK